MDAHEILDRIAELSTPSGVTTETAPGWSVPDRMREVARLADAYTDSEHGDRQLLAERLTDAMERFADMLHDGR